MSSIVSMQSTVFRSVYQHKNHAILQSEICATKLIENLTFCRPMEFSIKLKTVKPGWSIVYIEGSRYNKKKSVFLKSAD